MTTVDIECPKCGDYGFVHIETRPLSDYSAIDVFMRCAVCGQSYEVDFRPTLITKEGE